MTSVYTASRTRHAHLWRELRDVWRGDLGVDIISTWIDEAGPGESASISDLWIRCVTEAATADFLVAYHEDGDTWKGAYVEIGAALASGKPVYVVGHPPGSWIEHPLVTLCESPDDALEDFIARNARPVEEVVAEARRLQRERDLRRCVYCGMSDTFCKCGQHVDETAPTPPVVKYATLDEFFRGEFPEHYDANRDRASEPQFGGVLWPQYPLHERERDDMCDCRMCLAERAAKTEPRPPLMNRLRRRLVSWITR